MNVKIYTDDNFRENLFKSTKLKGNHYHIKTAQEIIDEVIKEYKGIIIK